MPVAYTELIPYTYTGEIPYIPEALVHPIEPQTGGSPEPGDVVGRDSLILDIVAKARAGTNFIISDPRRMGKTATLLRLCNAPPADVSALYVNLEGARSIDEIALKTLDAIRSHGSLASRAKATLRQLLENATVEAGPLTLSTMGRALSASELLIRAFDAIDSKLGETEILIVAVDEVTVALENLCDEDPRDAAIMLQTLRNLRTRPGSKTRWILTGSVGFHHVIRKAGATQGLMADADVIDLGPLEAPYAAELAGRLLKFIDRPIEPEVIDHLVAVTSAIPFLMHQVAARLSELSGPVAGDDVDAALDGYFNARGKSAPATHLVTRLDWYYQDPKLAAEVLDHVALHAPLSFSDLLAIFESQSRDTMLRLVDDLVDDHYINYLDHTWRYGALRTVWITRRKLS